MPILSDQRLGADLRPPPTVGVKRVVCLANSRKPQGRCIAGKELVDGTWVRPISSRITEEISEDERQYSSGDEPSLLDIIDMPLMRRKPGVHQPENWLLSTASYWDLIGRMPWTSLADLADAPSSLWTNQSSTQLGRYDRISEIETASASLYLVHLDHLRLDEEMGRWGQRKVYGSFAYRGIDYRLTLTDPLAEAAFLGGGGATQLVGECYVTISLGEAYEGKCYKLLAAIIPRPI